MICLGGYHSSVHPDENDSIRLIQRAIDEGITFLDNAWDYHDGARRRANGKSDLARKPPREGLPHDQVLRPHRQGRTDPPGRQPRAPAHRSPRPLAVPRDRLRQRSRLDLRRRRRDRNGPQGQGTGQDPLPRLHRPQRSVDPSEDARKAVSLGDHPDAPLRARRPVPQLRAEGPARAEQPRNRRRSA